MTIHPDTTWPELVDAILTHDLPAQTHAWTPGPYAGRHRTPERRSLRRLIDRRCDERGRR